MLPNGAESGRAEHSRRAALIRVALGRVAVVETAQLDDAANGCITALVEIQRHWYRIGDLAASPILAAAAQRHPARRYLARRRTAAAIVAELEPYLDPVSIAALQQRLVATGVTLTEGAVPRLDAVAVGQVPLSVATETEGLVTLLELRMPLSWLAAWEEG